MPRRSALLIFLLIACNRKPPAGETAPGEWVGIILKGSEGQPEVHLQARTDKGSVEGAVPALATAVAAARASCLTNLDAEETVALQLELVGGRFQVRTAASATAKCVARSLEGAAGPEGESRPMTIDLELRAATP